MAEEGIAHIDLMKINIEGAEYEVLQHLIDSGLIGRITNVQVQFHDCVPFARARRASIRRQLEHTHELTYDFSFVWENWRLKTSDDVEPSEKTIPEIHSQVA